MKDDIMEKRTWHYRQNPKVFCIKCDKCDGDNIAWSEYRKKIWCYDCEIDTGGTEGLFGSPINVDLCRSMGILFETVDI